MKRNPEKIVPCKKCGILRIVNPQANVPDLCLECAWEADPSKTKQPLQKYPPESKN